MSSADLNVILLLCLLGLNLGAQRLGGRDLGLCANGKVEKGNRNLETETDVVRSEVVVIGAVTVQLIGVVVIDGAEPDRWAAPRQIVSLCLQQSGARQRICGLNAGKGPWSFIGRDGRNLRNAGVIGRDGTVGQAGERGQLLGERGRAGFEMQAAELELRRRQFRLQQSAEGIDAGFSALLLDGDETGRILLLLANSFEFAS